MKKSCIYKITSPSGKFYIGKTIDFDSRMSSYRTLRNKDQVAIHASIVKYGWKNHFIEILEESLPEKLYELEIKYIKEHNSFRGDNPLGLNLTRGGEGSIGRKDSEETKEKRARKNRGSKRSLETRKLMSEIKKGKIPYSSSLPRSEKQLNHIKYGNLGRKKSKEAAEKELKTKLGKFLNTYGGILQIDLEGNVVKEWSLLPKHVAKELQIDDSYFLTVLKSRGTKKLKNFYWYYKINRK